VPQYLETKYCADGDVNHEWEKVHQQWNLGKMDGFVVTNEDSEAPMGQYGRGSLPVLYWLADQFATSDRYFSSLLGPTWPNRYFLWAATAWGRTSTPNQGDWRQVELPKMSDKTIFKELDDKGLSVRLYGDNSFALTQIMLPSNYSLLWRHSIEEFEADAASGSLPAMSVIEPKFGGSDASDDHPPADVRRGQAFIRRVVAAVSQPATWNDTVLFITYDEHGGYYDHVPPPAACPPDTDAPPSYACDRLGMRVPLLAISRWSRQGYVGKVVADHTSITRFIENRWDLGALTKRDANAWPLLDLFDFGTPRDFPTDMPAFSPPVVSCQ